MATSNVEEYQFTDTGIILNTSPSLPFVDIDQVSGLDSAPTRLTTKDHEGVDGGFVDSSLETLRTVVIDAIAYASPTGFDAYMDQLRDNYSPSALSQPFYFTTDSGNRVVYGKSQGLRYTKTRDRSFGKQKFQVVLLCEDSRVYSPETITSGDIILGSGAVGGRGYPKGYTFGYGAVASSSSGSITPGGTRETPGLYTITGPITNPVIVNDTLGVQWTFIITLAAGETLVINPRLKTVRLGVTGPSRRNTMRGPWWFLLKSNNTFRLLGSGGTAATKLVITAQRAWR